MTENNNKKEKVDRYNGATELGTKVLIFYGGVFLFLALCIIPPMTVILPFAIPIIFIVCLVMNIGFIAKFIDITKKELDERTDKIHSAVFNK